MADCFGGFDEDGNKLIDSTDYYMLVVLSIFVVAAVAWVAIDIGCPVLWVPWSVAVLPTAVLLVFRHHTTEDLAFCAGSLLFVAVIGAIIFAQLWMRA